MDLRDLEHDMSQYNSPVSVPIPRSLRGHVLLSLRVGKRRFEPGVWPTVATLIIFPLLVALGFWQLDRAAQKAALEARFQARISAPPVELDAADARALAAHELAWCRVILSGHFEPRFRFLLDNQVLDERPGYFVYVPFRLASGGPAILVNEGWVPLGPDRASIPRIPFDEAATRVEGMAKPPPATGLFLGGGEIDSMGDKVFRLQRVDPTAIEASSGLAIMPFVVRLDAADGPGMERKWRLPGIDRDRHLGYAYQWFALAAALACIFVGVNLKRSEEER